MFDWLRESWNVALLYFGQMFLAMRIPPIASRSDEHDDVEIDSFKLIYFDVRGLGQAIRDSFKFTEIDFEDKRLSFDEFSKDVKPTAPFGQLPLLEINQDLTITQSKTILRYASKKARTYPRNHEYAAIIDQWCDLHTDFMNLLTLNMYGERYGLADAGYDKTKHRAWILENHIPKYFGFLETELKDGHWIGRMDTISMADFCWNPTLCWLRDGTFDGVSADTFSKYPNILRFMEDVAVQLEESGAKGSRTECEYPDDYSDTDKNKDE